MNNAKTTFVKSHCGTGKTYQIVSNIKKLLETNDTARVLFVSCRISFSHCITKTLNDSDIPFVSYDNQELSHDELLKSQFLMCQVESLHKYCTGSNHYDLVIIDEAVSIYHQINSFTNIYKHIQPIINFINKSSYNIICDAFINQTFINWYLSNITNTNHQIINNTYKPYLQNTEQIMYDPIDKDDAERIAELQEKYDTDDITMAGAFSKQQIEEMKQEHLELIDCIKTPYEYSSYTNQCQLTLINSKTPIKNMIYKITQRLDNNQKTFCVFSNRKDLVTVQNYMIE